MKKVLSIILSLLIVCILCSCGDSKIQIEKEIIGNWRLTDESEDVNQTDFYPEEDYLSFSEDGTWNNKKSNTYIISHKSITMDSNNWVSQYTYVVSISNDVLMLQYPGEEPLYFERVD